MTGMRHMIGRTLRELELASRARASHADTR